MLDRICEAQMQPGKRVLQYITQTVLLPLGRMSQVVQIGNTSALKYLDHHCVGIDGLSDVQFFFMKGDR